MTNIVTQCCLFNLKLQHRIGYIVAHYIAQEITHPIISVLTNKLDIKCFRNFCFQNSEAIGSLLRVNLGEI